MTDLDLDLTLYRSAVEIPMTPLERIGEALRGIFDRHMDDRRIEVLQELLSMEPGQRSSLEARCEFLDFSGRLDGRGRRFREAQLIAEDVCIRFDRLSDRALLSARTTILKVIGQDR